jgi:hypothetical protein
MRKHHPWGSRPEPTSAADAPAFISGLLPDDLFSEAPTVSIDRDEIVIVGRIPAPATGADASEADRAAAESGRIAQFRETTRDQRIQLAQQVEYRYERKVAWGVRCGSTEQMFTRLAAPVMTRLRQPQRQVLDTLVDAGVARSRSEALAWCVHLVGEHAQDWLGELREAMNSVDELRKRGPNLD